MDSIANNLVSIIGFIIGLIAWFIRLESKVQYLEKDHMEHKALAESKDAKMWEKVDSLQNSMNQLLMAVGEIKGKSNH